MSKRTLILFGIGVLLLVGALFSLKMELNNENPKEDIEEEEEEPVIPETNVSEEKAGTS
jgi:hypothetical protein